MSLSETLAVERPTSTTKMALLVSTPVAHSRSRYQILFSATLLLLLATTCSPGDEGVKSREMTSSSGASSGSSRPELGARASRLQAVNNFLYQLQNIDLNAIGHTAYDLVVLDYSADGSDERAFTREQITWLRHSPGGEKIVLAYMSIGEAEDYRFYWRPARRVKPPLWLDAANPDWPGNYKVRYWDPEWQAIILAYTDKLVNAGFDGAYLDLVDAYEYFAEQGRKTAAHEMRNFVEAIAAHARRRDPDFYIFPQNGAELARLMPSYLEVVDGIGQEDTYYGYERDDSMTPAGTTRELEQLLDLFKAAGKLVLTIDYATTPTHVNDAYAKSRAKGYVPFVTVRDLDRLTINTGHELD